MTEKYNPHDIEPKWQARWEADGLYRSSIDRSKPKYYALTMLPYPRGDLHIGHWYAMAPSDARARFMRMQGYNVLFPMGFDAFGLPAENAAIQRGIHPKKWTWPTSKRMRSQLKTHGRHVGLGTRSRHLPARVLPMDAVVLSQVLRSMAWPIARMSPGGLLPQVQHHPGPRAGVGRGPPLRALRHAGDQEGPGAVVLPHHQLCRRAAGCLARSTGPSGSRPCSQLDRPQRGRRSRVPLRSRRIDIEVFTTRPDTLWGATFMVLAPEHPLVDKLTTPERRSRGRGLLSPGRAPERDRAPGRRDKEKTGVFTGAYAINPVNGARIPIWIADYVMMTYGTGAIMAVPAHDERDFAFALKYGLPIIPVIDRADGVAKSLVLPGSVRWWVRRGAARGSGSPLRSQRWPLVRDPAGGRADRALCRAGAQRICSRATGVEVVGARWLFIFDDGSSSFDSVEADQASWPAARRWSRRCRSAAARRWRCCGAQAFYRDVLFHAEYGTMINSGAFSGTPGDGPSASDRMAASGRRAASRGQLSPARLADQPPALLGRADPHRSTVTSGHRARALRGSARAAAR